MSRRSRQEAREQRRAHGLATGWADLLAEAERTREARRLEGETLAEQTAEAERVAEERRRERARIDALRPLAQVLTDALFGVRSEVA